MKVTAIELKNVRGFVNVEYLELSNSINIFIGANNSGKSTILNSILMLQNSFLNRNDVTIGKTESNIILHFTGKHRHIDETQSKIRFDLSNEQQYYTTTGYNNNGYVNQIPNEEPYNLIYPYLSKRKVTEYSNLINEKNANIVSGNFQNLYSKIDRIITPQFQPENSEYIEACESILGFVISTIPKGEGKQAIYYIHSREHIPLTAMGEGVANILGLIVDLCIAKDKIFIIEEPENDIHPKALKALLNFIIKKSSTNQFFISTHSNIVMKYLGAETETKIFNITNELRDIEREKLFISNIEKVSNDPEDRRRILEDLGYEFFDFDMWEGWLFLEEASAEVIIRDYLINWFAPKLKGKIKTFSAGGTGNVEKRFEDFNKLFVFLHLAPTYRNKVWVIIDAGEKESEIINQLKEKYCVKSNWKEESFSQFNEHDFEIYYPDIFQEEAQRVLALKNNNDRRTAKKLLIDNVKEWIAKNEEVAKQKFKVSADEVIKKLLTISSKI